MDLDIPEHFRGPLARFATLAPEVRQKVISTVATCSPSFYPDGLGDELAEKLGIDATGSREMARLLVSFLRVHEETGLSVDEFARSLVDSAKTMRDPAIDLTEEQWLALSRDLVTLLQQEGPLCVTAKASDLMTEGQRNFLSGRIVTDVRPVFASEVDKGPAAALIVHHLRIACLVNSEVEEYFFDLDGNDLRELEGLVTRAIEKECSLSDFLHTAELPFLDSRKEEQPK